MSNRGGARRVALLMRAKHRIANLIVVGLALLATLPTRAEDPPLPRPRPESAGTVVPLPRPRPDLPASLPIAPPEAPAAAGDATEHEPRAETSPEAAPARVYQTACPAVLTGLVEAKALPPLSEGQCGAVSPLSLTGVLANGRMVPVAGGVVTDCGMASALPGWVSDIDGYLRAREKTGIAELVIGTSYMCRNVNNASVGNLSFHGLADALDVVGFRLEDGRFVTVADDWADPLAAEGRLLRFAHDAACSRFTTTLGPEANAEHRDHFHIDLGCHGKTCIARLCE